MDEIACCTASYFEDLDSRNVKWWDSRNVTYRLLLVISYYAQLFASTSGKTVHVRILRLAEAPPSGSSRVYKETATMYRVYKSLVAMVIQLLLAFVSAFASFCLSYRAFWPLRQVFSTARDCRVYDANAVLFHVILMVVFSYDTKILESIGCTARTAH